MPNEIDDGARHLCEIERLIKECNKKEKQVPLRLPDLKNSNNWYGIRI